MGLLRDIFDKPIYSGGVFGDILLVGQKEKDYKSSKRADHVLAGTFRGKKIERNAPCPCGSGRKFKQCCMRRKA